MNAHAGAARGVECANLALLHFASLEPADASRLANLGIECALDAPKDTPSRREAIDALEQRLQPTVEAPPAGLSDLDLSQIHRHLIRAREDVEDKPGAKKVAEQWLLVIDRVAARAPTPRARAVYDAHRFIASLTLGEWERLIPPMLATEQDVPGDFMAALYLGSAYRMLGRLDEALGANDRSLARSYGAYRSRILSARAGILLAKGEREMAQKVVEEAIQYVQGLNPALVRVWIMPELEQRLKQVQSP